MKHTTFAGKRSGPNSEVVGGDKPSVAGQTPSLEGARLPGILHSEQTLTKRAEQDFHIEVADKCDATGLTKADFERFRNEVIEKWQSVKHAEKIIRLRVREGLVDDMLGAVGRFQGADDQIRVDIGSMTKKLYRDNASREARSPFQAVASLLRDMGIYTPPILKPTAWQSGESKYYKKYEGPTEWKVGYEGGKPNYEAGNKLLAEWIAHANASGPWVGHVSTEGDTRRGRPIKSMAYDPNTGHCEIRFAPTTLRELGRRLYGACRVLLGVAEVTPRY